MYRGFAEGAVFGDSRRAYLDIAESCDQIAARLEKLEADEMARALQRQS